MSETRRISKRALAQIAEPEAEEEGGTLVLLDDRSRELRQITSPADPETLARIAEVFEGTDLPDDRTKVQLIAQLRTEIEHLWANAQKSFLGIGKALLDAERTLTKREYDLLLSSSNRLFPFNRTSAIQLRAVARAIAEEVIPEESCPLGYTVAYELTTLKEEDLEEAKRRNLVRPDLKRTEIKQFKSEIRLRGRSENHIDRTAAFRRRDQLIGQREKLRDQITALDEQIEELNRLLN